jgi:hypothetical protein
MAQLTKQAFANKKGISENVLNKWISRYGLPVYQIGRRVYIDEDEYDAWWANHRRVVGVQLEEKAVEIAIPKQCRGNRGGILGKLRPAR